MSGMWRAEEGTLSRGRRRLCGALCVAELTAAEVRVEFSVLALIISCCSMSATQRSPTTLSRCSMVSKCVLASGSSTNAQRCSAGCNSGLWEGWKDPNGRWIKTCTILTTTPNTVTSAVHDRMPVILDPDSYVSFVKTSCNRKINNLVTSSIYGVPVRFLP